MAKGNYYEETIPVNNLGEVLVQFVAYACWASLQNHRTTGKQNSKLRSSGQNQIQGESASPGYTSMNLVYQSAYGANLRISNPRRDYILVLLCRRFAAW